MRFLVERWGEEAPVRLTMLVGRQGESMDQALREVTGMGLEDFEAAWLEWVKEKAEALR